jgi:hypothetical protein
MKFKPEDFYCLNGASEREEASERANEMLREWLVEAPVVYGIGQPGEPYVSDEDYWWTTRSGEDTHTARLIGIEEIQKNNND